MNQKQQAHGISYGTLLSVLTTLLALTAITVYASQIDMGALNIWVALLIASTKASLVLMFFMHLRYESGLLKYTFTITVFTLAIIIGLTFWDVAFR
ncbi:MAG: caa(3)-type oxidase subunit 4 [Deltaproteobacteria bacterium]|nr:caa(3)-type oxidase subunit 4 [Deltaproteobacteria bacterium]MBT4526261.1 caa(3)-type oxidase subunit 4 [Deltaproteobacteria bacterium]